MEKNINDLNKTHDMKEIGFAMEKNINELNKIHDILLENPKSIYKKTQELCHKRPIQNEKCLLLSRNYSIDERRQIHRRGLP